MSSIIWTRAIDDWQRDLALAKKLNVESKLIHIPCVSFSALPVSDAISVANYVIFNSSNAVRFAMAHEKLALVVRTAVKIFSIGAGTSEALKEFDLSATPGFAGNSAKQLADQILQSGVGGTFLIPTAKETAFDSAAYLRSHGRSAQAVPCYETRRLATKVNGAAFTEAEAKAEAGKLSGVICFASPSAVEGFCKVFNAIDGFFPHTKLVPLAIGTTTQTAVLKHFDSCHLSSESSVTALLTEAQKQLAKQIVQ